MMCLCMWSHVCLYLSYTLTHLLLVTGATPPPVFVSISALAPCLNLCELLGSCCGWVSRYTPMMCRCVCLCVLTMSASHTHTSISHHWCHVTTCPRQHLRFGSLSESLRALELVLWLGVAIYTHDVSMYMSVCLDYVCITHVIHLFLITGVMSPPVLVSISALAPCLNLCELLSSCWWLGVAIYTHDVSMCVSVCLDYVCITHVIHPISHHWCHVTTCPRQHLRFGSLSESLRALGLVLWLGVVIYNRDVSVCVSVCLDYVCIYTLIHPISHHWCHVTTCPRQHLRFGSLSESLRALVLVLWLGVVLHIHDMSVCVID